MDISNIQLRALTRQTPLSRQERIVIAAPSEASGIDAANRLKDALSSVVDNVEVETDPGAEVIKRAEAPVFVIGNLSNSLCVRELYWLVFVATDRWYPGPSGYEVRTLMDPLGTGHNIVHLGYSDDEGLEAGASILLDRIADPLPFFNEVHAVRFPIPEYEVEEARKVPMLSRFYGMADMEPAKTKCYLAYLSNEKYLVEESHKFWEDLKSYLVPPGIDRIIDLHLRFSTIVSLFRLMEQTGMIEEALRKPILHFICEMINQLMDSDNRVSHILDPAYQNESFPRQNHGLIPALGITLAVDYFNRHHPDLKEPNGWKEVADRVFAPYNEGSWKPLCDGLCHGWWLSQPVMLDYALLDPEHRYFESGGARQAADCALAVTNNQGWLPSSGDSVLTRAFAGPSLRVAAAWYNDGRYRFVHELAPEYRRHPLMAFLPRAFCTDVKPVEPVDDTGLTTIPMDPLIYHVWQKTPELAKERSQKPPHAPIEKCFDKLIFRAGWNIDDDCLLVDGLGHFSHSYADAMEIIEYARFGLSFIVSEHGLQNPEPESHSIVTITRDGEIGAIPGWAEILESSCDKDGNGYVSLRLEDFAGADWVRELHFRKGVGVLIHDTITATRPGEYAIQTHLRIPGRVSYENNVLECSRNSTTAGEIKFRLSGSCSEGIEFRVDEADMSLLHRNPPGIPIPSKENCRMQAWKDRYHVDERVISIFSGRVAATLQPDESVCFTQFAQAIGPGEVEYEIVPGNGTVSLVSDGHNLELPVSGRSKRLRSDSRSPVAPHRYTEPVELVRFRTDISSMISAGEGKLLCGLEDGTLTLIDNEGKAQWDVQLPGRIHDATALIVDETPMYFAGHGDTGLSALGKEGEVSWAKDIVREPTACPHWELNSAAAVQVKSSIAEGLPFVAVGCGDLQVRIFRPNGEQTGRFYYRNGVPGYVRIIDVDGDDIPEIVVGGEILSNQATCRILTPEGKLKHELAVEGWTSKLTSWACGQNNGRYYVACGASRGKNLHVYELNSGRDKNAGAQHVLEKRLGGAVMGVALFPGDDAVIAGTSMGFVVAQNFDGSVRWHKLLDHGVSGLSLINESIFVWSNNGYYCQLTLNGELMIENNLAPPAGNIITHPENNEVFLANGSAVMRLDIP